MVTVLHCNWGYSALCNLQPEGSTHVEGFIGVKNKGGSCQGRREQDPQRVHHEEISWMWFKSRERHDKRSEHVQGKTDEDKKEKKIIIK